MFGFATITGFAKSISDRSGLSRIANAIKGFFGGRMVQSRQASQPEKGLTVSSLKPSSPTDSQKKQKKGSITHRFGSRVQSHPLLLSPTHKKEIVTPDKFEKLTGFRPPSAEDKAAMQERVLERKKQAAKKEKTEKSIRADNTHNVKVDTTFNCEQVIKEYNSQSSAFKEACISFGVNPRKQFTLASLADLSHRLKSAIEHHSYKDEASLRHQSRTTMLRFIEEYKTHKPRTKTTTYRLYKKQPPQSPLPLLKPHPNVDRGTKPSAYLFRINGDEPVSSESGHFHRLVLKKLANEWEPSSVAPQLPKIKIDFDYFDFEEGTARNDAAYTIDTSPLSSQEQAALQQQLLKSTICTRSPTEQDPQKVLIEFQQRITEEWDTVCRLYKGIISPPTLNLNECKELLARRELIEESLKELGNNAVSQPARLYLGQSLSVTDEYIKGVNFKQD
ncbi:hypothetical protein ACH42_03130 [Endozoicomonas sp. (ex Bugula neritina AB1)]|nr:hypothetical protein ACH42_03130 [Endozoicomonas sp. (ex Bugula neritina AB1)]